MSWQKLNFGEIVDKIVGGGTPSKSKSEYWGGDIYWATVKDMTEGRYKLSKTQDMISQDGLDNSSSNLIPKGTLIIATRMGLGRAFINSVPMAINQDLKAIYPNTECVDNDFLLWNYISKASLIENMGNGATVKGIRLEQLKSIEIELPSLKTQKRIAGILSAYDDLIENNLKRIKLLEQAAQNIYKEWFVNFRFPGYEFTPINEETGLPEGWERLRCNDVMEIMSGGTPKTNNAEYWEGNIQFFTPKDASNSAYTNGTIKKISQTGLNKCNSKLYPKDTVFITARGTVGKINLADQAMAMNQSCYALKGKNDVTPYFLYNSLMTIIKSIKGMTGGGVFDTIVVDTFKHLKIQLPTKELIIQFENKVTAFYGLSLLLLKQNQKLKAARDILLPRLMNQTIEV